MNCSRNDNMAKYLKRCAIEAVKAGQSKEDFVAEFVASCNGSARGAYDSVKTSLRPRCVCCGQVIHIFHLEGDSLNGEWIHTGSDSFFCGEDSGKVATHSKELGER